MTDTDTGSATYSPSQVDSFRPRLLLSNGHAQTLWRKFAAAPQIQHRRQRVELADGDFIDIDWHDPESPVSHSSVFTVSDPADDTSANNRTIVLLLHGLCGCSQSGYIQSLQHQLGQAGYLSVAMNFRGCSGEINRLARAYHSGVTDDLTEVIGALQAQLPGYRFALVGFSLGANVLLKWLGEGDRKNEVVRAVAVSTPFNLALCSRAMQGGLSRLYGRYFLRRLVADAENKKQHFQHHGNQEQWERLQACGDLQRLASLWEFDDRVTAPLHGFQDANDYYEQCSSIGFLNRINVPTLLLQSRDDPIIPPPALPGDHHLSDHLLLDFSERGGHVGFASSADRFWMENRIVNFIASGPGCLR